MVRNSTLAVLYNAASAWRRGVFLTQDEPEGEEKPHAWELIVSVKNGGRLSLEQIRTFLAASEEFRFEANNREEIYD